MCGIVGISKRASVTLGSAQLAAMTRLFSHLLVKAAPRGREATGMFQTGKHINEKNKVWIKTLRAPVASESFLKSERYKQIINDTGNSTFNIVGHTRQSTTSSFTNNHNNHPHRAGRIIGVHNGHINNSLSLCRKRHIELKGNCDSEGLFALVNYHLENDAGSVPEAIRRTLAEVEGWYALAMVDLLNPNILYLVRDGHAPLYVAFAPLPKLTIFGSTEYIIADAAKTAGVEIVKPISIDGHKIYGIDSESEATFEKPYVFTDYGSAGSSLKPTEIDDDMFKTTQGL